MKMSELIKEVENRVPEIIEAIKSQSAATYPVAYESEEGVSISCIQVDHDTRTTMIAFGACKPTENSVRARIDREKEDLAREIHEHEVMGRSHPELIEE